MCMDQQHGWPSGVCGAIACRPGPGALCAWPHHPCHHCHRRHRRCHHQNAGKVKAFWRQLFKRPADLYNLKPLPDEELDFAAPVLVREAIEQKQHVLYLSRTNGGWFAAAVALAEVRGACMGPSYCRLLAAFLGASRYSSSSA